MQRLAVLLACACWTALLWSPRSPGPRGDDLVPELMEGAEELPSGFRWSVLCAIITLSCVERLAAGGNMVVMERDWVCESSIVFPLHRFNHFGLIHEINLLPMYQCLSI